MTVNSEGPVETIPAPVATVLSEVQSSDQVTVEAAEQIVMQHVDMSSAAPTPGLETMVEGQVIMMTGANGEQQPVVITSAGITPLSNGDHGQVTSVTSGAGDSITESVYMLETNTLKTEPEDLSFRDDQMRHSIDLEAGAQAIQASAANAVQNVLRSLKE